MRNIEGIKFLKYQTNLIRFGIIVIIKLFGLIFIFLDKIYNYSKLKFKLKNLFYFIITIIIFVIFYNYSSRGLDVVIFINYYSCGLVESWEKINLICLKRIYEKDREKCLI